MARSTNNPSLSITKIIVADGDLVNPPLKPRAIRRKATRTAERRKLNAWLLFGGDDVIDDINEHNSPDVADALIARKKSRAIHRPFSDLGSKEHTAHWKAKTADAATDWSTTDVAKEVAYELDQAEQISYSLGLKNHAPLQIDAEGHRTPSFRLAWVEYPGKPSKAQIRATPRKCKDQFCGCRGYTPLGAAVTR